MKIEAFESVHYPDSERAYHPVVKGEDIVARYHYKINEMGIIVEYADLLPKILKVVGLAYGVQALNGNIVWEND